MCTVIAKLFFKKCLKVGITKNTVGITDLKRSLFQQHTVYLVYQK